MAVIYDINYDNTNVYSSIAGWGANGGYRQITLEKPATGDLLTWLEANAVRLPLTGTYVFNSTLSAWSSSLNNTSLYTTFESNGTTYSKFDFIYGARTGLYYNSTLAYVLSDASEPVNTWINQAYRTITFTEPVQYKGNEEFVKWFTANAKPLPAKGKTLNEYTWDEISRISLADKAVEYGFKVGDAKEVTLNGRVGYGNSTRTFSNQKYWVYIIGINHNEAKEGKGIAFQGFKTAQTGGIDIAVTATNYGSTSSGMVMNNSQTNAGGWNGSWAYSTCMSQWKSCFPSELQSVIRTTTLYTDNTGNSSTSTSAVTANDNGVYYLAEYEVFGSNHYANTNEPAQQAQYDYYKAVNSSKKYRSDSTSKAAHWWLRSPYRSDGLRFCRVYDFGGSAHYSIAYISNGSAPCFKV